jgi:hypothetical protein
LAAHSKRFSIQRCTRGANGNMASDLNSTSSTTCEKLDQYPINITIIPSSNRYH